jgi:hypothetical protein
VLFDAILNQIKDPQLNTILSFMSNQKNCLNLYSVEFSILGKVINNSKYKFEELAKLSEKYGFACLQFKKTFGEDRENYFRY